MQILDGIKVLDMTHFLAGPYCGMQMADMGAEVIKIERPGEGDFVRQVKPFKGKTSLYYNNVNRGKKGLTLDLKTKEGIEIFKTLIKEADVVIENNRPGVMDRMGIGYTDASKINPGIIYASISGYGQTGAYAGRAGFDLMAQASSGSMSITGEKDGRDLKTGISIGDILAGMNATIGILASLRHRDKTGEGQQLDISLVDGLVSAMESNVLRPLYDTAPQEKVGNQFYYAAPYESFSASDGDLVLACFTDEKFGQFCEEMGEKLYEIPNYSTVNKRLANREELAVIIGEWSKDKKVADICARMDQLGIPCAPVNNLKQVYDDDFIRETRKMFVKVEHKEEGELVLVGNPIKFSKTPVCIKNAGPELGEHSEEILRKYAYSEEEIETLKQNHVI